jgi:penicillin-binding protein 1A
VQLLLPLRKIFFVGCVAVLTLALGCLTYLMHHPSVDFNDFFSPTISISSVIVDEYGVPLATFERDKRQPIQFAQLPQNLVNAFVAAEDRAFFDHSGISFKGILRSFLVNLYHRRVVQGASTITQQLVRLLCLSQERHYWRKIREMFLAFQLERQMSKQQIFELYVNNIYFGRGIYGVEAACRRFWAKSVTDITLDEAATLAAVAKSARYYSPLNAPDNSRQRRNIILYSMSQLGMIDALAYAHARSAPLTLSDQVEKNNIRQYLIEWIRQWVEKQWGREALYTQGLTIKTTLDSAIQEKAEEVFKARMTALRQKHGAEINGGMVAIEAGTGKIRASIGGYDFKESQYNRAFKAVRQLGSSFKPIIYTLGLLQGIPLNSIWVDEPLEIALPGAKKWCPKNWTNRFDGPMTLLKALTFSNNIITIKLLKEIGYSKVIDYARRCGIMRNLEPYPSLALGIAEGTTEENAAAFAVFAQQGVYVRPYLIEWVKDASKTKIWSSKTERHRVWDQKTNAQMVRALQQRIDLTERRSGKHLDCQAIGKTGSTNGASTVWFVGATPEIATAVYVGRDDGKQIGAHVFASQMAFPIWYDFAQGLVAHKKLFYHDPSLHEVVINWDTGQVVSCPNKQSPAEVSLLT